MTARSLTLAAVLLAGTASAQTYGPYPQETYTTCGDPKSATALELVHGGAWAGGSDDMPSVAMLCKYLGARGIYAVSIAYRLSPVAPWPAQLQDAQRALSWMRATLPAKRIGVLGTSAGGHIALSLAQAPGPVVYPRTDPLGEATAPGDVIPDFVIDVSGPTNLTDKTLLPETVALLLRNNGMPDTVARAYASPIAHLSTDLPPLLITHGNQDIVVPVGQSNDFTAFAGALGIPVRMTNASTGVTPAACHGITFDLHTGGHVFNYMGSTRLALFDEIARFAKGQCA